MKSTIWIARENEEFWSTLDNKSGFVNAVIDSLLEEEIGRKTIYKNGEQDEEDETIILQDIPTEVES